MRYAIMDFNQVKLAEIQKQDSSFDMNDVLLMQYIKDAISRKKMIKIHDENGQTYVWLKHSKIHEDLPFLNMKEETLKKHIKKLIDLGLIESKVFANKDGRGTKSYYATTDLFDSLIYDDSDNIENDQVYQNTPESVTKCTEIHLKERPGVSEYPSDSTLNNTDSKLEKDDNTTILKNSTAEPSITKKSYTRKSININDDFSDKLENKSKEKNTEHKKLNLYEKGMLEIEKFTDDENLRESLRNYFKLRMGMKDKPIRGIGQWNGLLKTLAGLNGDKVAIVNRAIERGWASFYELKDYQYKNSKKSNTNIFGESDRMERVRPEDVEGGGFSGVIF